MELLGIATETAERFNRQPPGIGRRRARRCTFAYFSSRYTTNERERERGLNDQRDLRRLNFRSSKVPLILRRVGSTSAWCCVNSNRTALVEFLSMRMGGWKFPTCWKVSVLSRIITGSRIRRIGEAAHVHACTVGTVVSHGTLGNFNPAAGFSPFFFCCCRSLAFRFGPVGTNDDSLAFLWNSRNFLTIRKSLFVFIVLSFSSLLPHPYSVFPFLSFSYHLLYRFLLLFPFTIISSLSSFLL